MFDASPNDLDVAALNASEWEGSALCGACADVQGPLASLRIRVVDLCPECPSGNLDFSESAFAKIAKVSAGRVPITWSLVACDVSGPVQYRYKDGSNQWWTAVQVLNHRLPVTTLEWSSDGSSWNPTERASYNYFLAASGFGPNPVRVRITAMDGQTLVDSLPSVQAGLVTTGQAQFR
jgi:expansin (peptidoglycan-binding protein)